MWTIVALVISSAALAVPGIDEPLQAPLITPPVPGLPGTIVHRDGSETNRPATVREIKRRLKELSLRPEKCQNVINSQFRICRELLTERDEIHNAAQAFAVVSAVHEAERGWALSEVLGVSGASLAVGLIVGFLGAR